MIKRHDDPMFEMFREGLQGYTATPPAGAYAGIRKQMRKQSFFAFAWHRMNIYYLGLLVSAGVAWAMTYEAPVTGAQQAYLEEAVLNMPPLSFRDSEVKEEGTTTLLAEVETAVATPEARTERRQNTRRTKPTGAEYRGEVPASSTGEELVAATPVETHCDFPKEKCEPIAPMQVAQLPVDWVDHVAKPDLDGLVQQLNSDAEVVYLKLNVKVPVEDID